ncbi:MAG TPA: hypothetical protein VMV47_10775 [Bacteroidales bacterium]|nr:hypothetical protein [Bacteroidales bacterium]
MKVLKPSGNLHVKIIFLFSIALLSFLISCNRSPGNKAESSDNPNQVKPATAEISKHKEDAITPLSADSLQSLLKGKWLREDGTYTIEIFSISANGIMDAGYFNPNPINVGKSGWMINEGNIMLEIILKDVNYPGSKYNLFYDKISDCLIGNYFQAVQGINYDVLFSRYK